MTSLPNTQTHRHHSSSQAVRNTSAGGGSSLPRLASDTTLFQCAEGDAKLSRPIGVMINGRTFWEWLRVAWAWLRDAVDVLAFWLSVAFLVTVFAVVVAG